MNEVNSVSRLEHVLFYVIEKSIKSYRQFAQHNIKKVNRDITIDQWLILKIIDDNPEITQREIADYVFKDHASITRMINLLVNKKFLERSLHQEDRRRFGLKLTVLGKQTKEELMPVILRNREVALNGLTENEIGILKKALNKITVNCSKT